MLHYIWAPATSSRQPFKAPSPSYTGSDHGGEETCRPHRGFYWEVKAYFLDQEYSGLYDEDVWECIECYLNLPDTPHLDENPLNHAHIHKLQQQDKQLLALQVKYPDNYVYLQLDDNVDDIICYKKDPTQPNWKIVLPDQW